MFGNECDPFYRRGKGDNITTLTCLHMNGNHKPPHPTTPNQRPRWFQECDHTYHNLKMKACINMTLNHVSILLWLLLQILNAFNKRSLSHLKIAKIFEKSTRQDKPCVNFWCSLQDTCHISCNEKNSLFHQPYKWFLQNNFPFKYLLHCIKCKRCLMMNQ